MFQSIKEILGSPKATQRKEETVNIDAGAEILTHFQTQWAELHEINESNAKCAENVAETIFKLHEKIVRDNVTITGITQLLNSPNGVENSLRVCGEQIQNLTNSFEDVENGLLELEKLVLLCEFEKRKMEHRHELALYKKKKSGESCFRKKNYI